MKYTRIFLILSIIASDIAFSGATFAACTTVTIDYWYADWYADAWLTKCGETQETTFYASYNKNSVDIVVGFENFS